MYRSRKDLSIHEQGIVASLSYFIKTDVIQSIDDINSQADKQKDKTPAFISQIRTVCDYKYLIISPPFLTRLCLYLGNGRNIFR